MFFSPAQDLQRPSHPRLRIRDACDAQTIIEAVRRGILPLVERRLNEGERAMFIRSGAVFVWEENDDENGIKRWTDGRMWKQSRAKEPFLFYEEKLPEGAKVKSTGTYRFVDSLAQGTPRRSTDSHLPLTAGNPLTLFKQTYSAWVINPKTSKKKKWHITAYFAPVDLPDLATPSEDSSLRNIVISTAVSGGTRGRILDPYSVSEEAKGQRRAGKIEAAQIFNAYYYSSASATSASSHYDKRFPEDQRLIRMLDSQHIL